MSQFHSLPPFLQELWNSPPPAGAGFHRWQYCVARQSHAHMPAPQIISMIEERAAHCGRHVPKSEIVAAVTNSISTAWTRKGTVSATTKAPPAWPAVNTAKRAEIIKNGLRLADLWEASPVRLDSNEPHTEQIIDEIFPADALLCCGTSPKEFETKPREAWRGTLTRQSFIVPSPMSALTGLTKDGRESARTLSNVAPRRFLVVEFDTGTIDEHAAIVWHLAQFAPLTLAVHSGGKSLHAWFFAAGQPEEKVRKFFRFACSLGADPATWSPCQLVRMPDGTRDNGAWQACYYYNPRPVFRHDNKS
jgi:hypothetical protein